MAGTADPLARNDSLLPQPNDSTNAGEFKPEGLSDVVLPVFGIVFFNHMVGEFDSFAGRENDDAEAYRRAAGLREVYVKRSRQLTWGDVTAMECLLLRLRTEEELRERLLAVETRYCEIAPPNFYTRHVKLDEGEIKKLTVKDLRARIEVIACEFFRLCVLAECRERMRTRASTHVSIAMTVFLAAFIISVFLLTKTRLLGVSQWVLPGILFTGAMGGFVSAERRIQSVVDRGESLVDLVELSRAGANWLSPILGAIFAAVLYVIFAAQLLQGQLFPTISVPDEPGHLLTAVFSFTSGPAKGVDAAKLVLWCFVAGFAERFVPNALDRLIANAQQRRKRIQSSHR